MIFQCKNTGWNSFFYKANKNTNTFPIIFLLVSNRGNKKPKCFSEAAIIERYSFN